MPSVKNVHHILQSTVNSVCQGRSKTERSHFSSYPLIHLVIPHIYLGAPWGVWTPSLRRYESVFPEPVKSASLMSSCSNNI